MRSFTLLSLAALLAVSSAYPAATDEKRGLGIGPSKLTKGLKNGPREEISGVVLGKERRGLGIDPSQITKGVTESHMVLRAPEAKSGKKTQPKPPRDTHILEEVEDIAKIRRTPAKKGAKAAPRPPPNGRDTDLNEKRQEIAESDGNDSTGATKPGNGRRAPKAKVGKKPQPRPPQK